jgi:hypothetical protein
MKNKTVSEAATSEDILNQSLGSDEYEGWYALSNGWLLHAFDGSEGGAYFDIYDENLCQTEGGLLTDCEDGELRDLQDFIQSLWTCRGIRIVEKIADEWSDEADGISEDVDDADEVQSRIKWGKG